MGIVKISVSWEAPEYLAHCSTSERAAPPLATHATLGSCRDGEALLLPVEFEAAPPPLHAPS